MANQRCATCKHFGYFKNDREQKVTICEREGPRLQAQAIVTDQGVAWTTTTAWPGVTAANGCAFHQVDILVANK
jgi:hypothetical protein